MWSKLFFAAVLMAIAGVLMITHVLAWRRADHGGLNDRDQRFFRNQYRRRMQASAMLGLVGILSLLDFWATELVPRVILWCVILLVVFWAVVLALFDWLASRFHYDRLLAANAVEQALLEREIARFREEQGGARSSKDEPKDEE